MLNLTKSAKETVYMKIIRVLLATCFLVVPLVFFTDLTANPFFTQNVLLYILMALIRGTLAFKSLRLLSFLSYIFQNSHVSYMHTHTLLQVLIQSGSYC